jgi:hypothetical protein
VLAAAVRYEENALWPGAPVPGHSAFCTGY